MWYEELIEEVLTEEELSLLADIIDDAADYMEEHGSCAGKFRDNVGRVCMEGALSGALQRKLSSIPVNSINNSYHALDAFVRKETVYTSTVSFSDGHSHQQRLDMMRRCAKELRT